VYRTTVFKTVGGQSRCPHEQGTAAREKFRLEFADGLTELTVFSKGEVPCLSLPAQVSASPICLAVCWLLFLLLLLLLLLLLHLNLSDQDALGCGWLHRFT